MFNTIGIVKNNRGRQSFRNTLYIYFFVYTFIGQAAIDKYRLKHLDGTRIIQYMLGKHNLQYRNPAAFLRNKYDYNLKENLFKFMD